MAHDIVHNRYNEHWIIYYWPWCLHEQTWYHFVRKDTVSFLSSPALLLYIKDAHFVSTCALIHLWGILLNHAIMSYALKPFSVQVIRGLHAHLAPPAAVPKRQSMNLQIDVSCPHPVQINRTTRLGLDGPIYCFRIEVTKSLMTGAWNLSPHVRPDG